MYQQLPQDCERRYHAGETLRELATSYDTSEETLRRRMNGAGIELRPRGTPVGKHRPRGGVIKDRDGYVLERVPDHPNANATGYVRQHRLVVERALGRLLSEEERVRHLNGRKDDNRLENLQVYASSTEEKRASLRGNQWSRGDLDNPKRRVRRRQSSDQILRDLALLQGTMPRPIRRVDLEITPHTARWPGLSVVGDVGSWKRSASIRPSRNPKDSATLHEGEGVDVDHHLKRPLSIALELILTV